MNIKKLQELIQSSELITKGIIIYGAGQVARVVAEKLLRLGINIFCFAVTARENNPFQILGIPVQCIEELMTCKDLDVVVATLQRSQSEIRIKLVQMGFARIYCMEDSLYYEWKEEEIVSNDKEDLCRLNYLRRYVEPYVKTVEELCREYCLENNVIQTYIQEAIQNISKSQLRIPRLVVVLGTKCSLRCRDCNNLMPYFQPQFDLNCEEILNSLKKITENVFSILKCELIGGEPFLSKNFSQVLQFVIENDVIKSVEITTNGTIIPDKKQIFWLQKNKVMIRISDYGTLVDKNKCIGFFSNNEIRYKVLELEEWIAPGGVDPRKKNKKRLHKEYGRCLSGFYCKTLYENKIFSCTRAASLYALGIMNEKEYIDIKEDFDDKMMKDFLLKKYSVACNYCDMESDDRKFVTPAIQIEY